MSDDQRLPNRLQLEHSLDLALEQGPDSDEAKRLAAFVSDNRELTREIVQQLRVHSLLEWQSHQVELLSPDFDGRELQAPPRRTLSRKFVAGCVAASLLIAASVGAWALQRRHASDSPILAEITRSSGVAWSDDTNALVGDKQVQRGRLDIEAGTITLHFRSGATLTAVGPVAMQVKSDMLVQLERGQATAHVPQWARGFTVETDDAEIVDMGTEFGVAARGDGKTDVVVFEGEVHVTPTADKSAVETRLLQGEGVSVGQESMDRIVEVRRNNRDQSWSTGVSADGIGLVRSIRDNLRSTSSPKYYEIMHHGFGEDVLAYVDRPHQWNGLKKEGLPEFLKNIDYVRTFNDDKYLGQLEIVVDVAHPAWLYLFFDDRVASPGWLKAQFEDTGVNIGLDEGPWIQADTTLRTAAGGGNSIDRVFSVWQMRCEHPGEVRLGALGASTEARAMYGVAARPLD